MSSELYSVWSSFFQMFQSFSLPSIFSHPKDTETLKPEGEKAHEQHVTYTFDGVILFLLTYMLQLFWHPHVFFQHPWNVKSSSENESEKMHVWRLAESQRTALEDKRRILEDFLISHSLVWRCRKATGIQQYQYLYILPEEAQAWRGD